MSTSRRLFPSKSLIIGSILVSAIVGYAIYYAFTEESDPIKIVVIIAALLIVLPILKMPISIYEDSDRIRIRQIVGETVFLKKEYTITRIDTKGVFSMRLFATSVFLYWGYFWSKSIGTFYALCLDGSDLILLTKNSDGSKIVIDAPMV